MAVFEFRRNASVLIDKDRYTLLKRLDDDTWQLEHQATGRLREHHHHELLDLLATGKLEYVADDRPSAANERASPTRTRATWDNATDKERGHAERALDYAKAVLPYPCSARQIKEVIATTAARRKDQATPSTSAVKRWRKSYLVGGKDVVALLPDIRKRGNRTDRVGEELRQLIDESLDAHHLTRERPTLQDTVLHVADKIRKRNANLPAGDPQLPVPTVRMVQAVLARRDPYDVWALRFGREYAERRFHQTIGKVTVTKGLQRLEADHTPMNCMVVDDKTFLPLGRPTLSAALDYRHKTFAGFCVSFTPPSYLSVMRLLRHAILPKTYVAKLFPEIKNTWPCHGVPDAFAIDHGKEFESEALQAFAARYGITLEYSPVARPWYKGSIERVLGTLNREVAHGQPGTTFANIFEKGDYDPEKTACITLSQLEKLIHIWIIDVYHQRVHRTLGVSPHASWETGMRHQPIPLPTSAIELEQDLAVPDRRQLSRKGVEFDCIFYNSHDLLPLLTHAKTGSVQVDIKRSPEDIGHIWVLNPEAEKYIRVDAVERFREYAKGLSAWQHQVIRRYAQKHYQGRNDVFALAEAKARIRNIVADALHGKKAHKRHGRFLEDDRAHQNGASPSSVPPATPAKSAVHAAAKPVRQGNPAKGLRPVKPAKARQAPRLSISFSPRRAA